ncbi:MULTISPECIES: F0F1 ATP synthase subunit delta [unclassified Francisella]|uniref:F0F1 ATP synthase subunit delta n=1 Tax=unclassified Francisella TaxID=2610885 RepID=UPI002E2F1D5A|nr:MULTISPECIES: F0F1 ATP synthase subunit delta [unclassified Francisella]MED7819049.1 F0F1 ATP synthase subunit delta [Francisella sp. 19S2-4]MED7829886.1 F0F1 ATP synthase subunit delta [Francisella sp. 19S2-10]
MVNLSVIAKPYAKAAFEFANENNLLQEWSRLLKVFAELIKDSSIAEIISSPVFSQVEIVSELKDQLDKNFFNFLILAAENKKLSVLPEIAKQFEVIQNASNNVKTANVTLAYAADEDLLNSLKKSLEKRFGCSINIKVDIDPAIVGGAIVKVGDTVIDNSVSGRLEKLKSILLS